MPPLRVHFTYRTLAAPYGGANSFNRNMIENLRARPEFGVEIIEDPRAADVLFVTAASRGPCETRVFSWRRGGFVPAVRDEFLRPFHLNNLKAGRFFRHPIGLWEKSSPVNGRPVVHRLDGLTFRYGRADGGAYDRLQAELNRSARLTVFQSRYCEESFRPLLRAGAASRIIPNGTDGRVFAWVRRDRPMEKIRLLAASWSKNRRKGQGDLLALGRLPRVELTFVGRWPDGVDPGPIRVLPAVPQESLAGLMAGAHAFVHLAENDPAPNIVVEALATGLPLIYRNSGGTPEIAGNGRYGEVLTGLSIEEASLAVDGLLSRYEERVEIIRSERVNFLIETSAAAYARAFHEAAGVPLPGDFPRAGEAG